MATPSVISAITALYAAFVPRQDSSSQPKHQGNLFTLSDFRERMPREFTERMVISFSPDSKLFPLPESLLDKIIQEEDRINFNPIHDSAVSAAAEISHAHSILDTSRYTRWTGHKVLRKLYNWRNHVPQAISSDPSSINDQRLRLLLQGDAGEAYDCGWYTTQIVKPPLLGSSTVGALIVSKTCDGCPPPADPTTTSMQEGLYASELAALMQLLCYQLIRDQESNAKGREALDELYRAGEDVHGIAYEIMADIDCDLMEAEISALTVFVINTTSTDIRVVEATLPNRSEPTIVFHRFDPIRLDSTGCKTALRWLFFLEKDQLYDNGTVLVGDDGCNIYSLFTSEEDGGYGTRCCADDCRGC